MEDLPRCMQRGPDCDSPAAFRFTWPGQNEKTICAIHAVRLAYVAKAIGLPLQIIPLYGASAAAGEVPK